MDVNDLFDSLMRKEKDNDRMASVSSGNVDGSSDHSASDRPLINFSSSNLPSIPQTSNSPPSSTPTPPVGNKVSLDFGFGPNDLNAEKEEDGKSFQTYKDSRSFTADVISFIERVYFDTGDLPEYKILHETFKDYPEAPRRIKGWVEIVDGIREQIEVRGLPTFRTADNYLEPAFITACNIILNIQDTRSDSAKLKELGLSTAKWNAWLKSKKYNDYYRERADKVFDQEIQVEAKRTVAKLVKNGDLSAVKYLNEWNGTYRQADNTTLLMQTFMSAILSILARNVPSNVINVIGAELRDDPNIKALLAGSLNAIESQAS